MICKPHRVPECLQCMKGKPMAGKCEHGLTKRVCLVCASPKYGALPAGAGERLTHEQACALHTMLDHYGNDPRMRCLVELLPDNMRRDFGA